MIQEIALELHISADSAILQYGMPENHLCVDSITVNPTGSVDLLCHYTKYRCHVCNNWYGYGGIDAHIGDNDTCDACATKIAHEHKCCDCPARADTMREGDWLCEACADKFDEIESWN